MWSQKESPDRGTLRAKAGRTKRESVEVEKTVAQAKEAMLYQLLGMSELPFLEWQSRSRGRVKGHGHA